MRIPEFLNRDDYLQNPILRRFLKDHRISFVENRADYIREIEAYSERDERSAAEVRDWLLHVIKEGSKEICYKKVRSINEWHRNPVLLEAKIQELYPDQFPQLNQYRRYVRYTGCYNGVMYGAYSREKLRRTPSHRSGGGGRVSFGGGGGFSGGGSGGIR